METPKFCNDSQTAAADAWKTIKISTSCRQLFSAHPKISNWKKQRGDRDGRVGVLLPKYVARRLTQFLANPHPRQREGWWVCWCQRRDYLPSFLGRTPLLFTTDAAAYQPLTNYSESMQYAGLFLTAGSHCYLPLNCIALIPLFCPPMKRESMRFKDMGKVWFPSPLPPLTATYWSAVYLVWFQFWRLMLVSCIGENFTILTSDHVLVSKTKPDY